MRNYIRANKPEPEPDPPPKRWRFTDRDQQIVLAMACYEGFLSVPQVLDLYFPPSKSAVKRAYKRLELLWRAGYLKRPTRQERFELPEMIYWLSKKGSDFVKTEGAGYTVERVVNGKTKNVLKWVKKPRFIQIRHDLMINEFHLDVELSCRETGVEIMDWQPSYVFHRNADQVHYTDIKGRPAKRHYQPDSYFMLNYNGQGRRFLLEIDRGRSGKEQVHRVVNEKILLGVPYLKSKDYEQRFGYNSGRMLIVTSGQGRLENLIERTVYHFPKLAQWYLFTTFDDVNKNTVVTEPIWRSYKQGEYKQVSLLTG